MMRWKHCLPDHRGRGLRVVHTGVILYRLAGLSSERKAAVILNLLRTHGDALLGAFSLVAPAHVRIRARVHGGQP